MSFNRKFYKLSNDDIYAAIIRTVNFVFSETC